MPDIKYYDNSIEKPVLHEKNGVLWISNPGLEALSFIKSGTSTRLGGVSEGSFASMNLAFHKGDSIENIQENYRIFFEAVGLEEHTAAYANQVHGTHVELVPEGHRTKAVDYLGHDYSCTDGLITKAPGVTLAMYSADCCVIFFADPVQKAVGMCHSGWRGTADKIAAEVIRRMTESFGTRPGDIVAGFAPSICPRCYEIGEDVASEFRKVFPKEVIPGLLTPKGSGKYLLNLWAANTHTLTSCGVLPQNIHQTNVCTLCNPDLLFSHRAHGTERGNNMSFIRILP